MKQKKLILYRIKNRGLELLFEKKRDNNNFFSWTFPEIYWSNLEISRFCSNASSLPISIEYYSSIHYSPNSCIAIEHTYELASLVKDKIIRPFFIKNGYFLTLKEIKTKSLQEKQEFIIRELSNIVSERRLLTLL